MNSLCGCCGRDYLRVTRGIAHAKGLDVRHWCKVHNGTDVHLASLHHAPWCRGENTGRDSESALELCPVDNQHPHAAPPVRIGCPASRTIPYFSVLRTLYHRKLDNSQAHTVKQ
jgi:hypothetical protein